MTQIKTIENDGYESIQLGFEPSTRANAPQKGHFEKSGGQPFRYVRELSADDFQGIELGSQVDVGIFETGEKVDVTGTSKGKGFQGGVKRYNFRGGPKTHGQSDRLRAPGSIGQASDPSRVWLGTKMAGQYGNKTAVVKNLQVIRIDADNHYLFLKGSVPGARNSLVMVTK